MSQEIVSPSVDSRSDAPVVNNVPEKGELAEQQTTDTNAPSDQQPLEGEALEEAVRHQLEYLLSRDHLATNYFLVSQMNAEMFLPLATLASLCTYTTDVGFITNCMKKSTTTTIDPTSTFIKPNFKISRTTIILRDIPSTAEAEKVQEIFQGEGCPSLSNLRPDIGDFWFASFASEEDTLKAFEFIRQKSFNGAPVKARIKSETLLRNFSNPVVPENVAGNMGAGLAGYNNYFQQMGYGYPARGVGWGGRANPSMNVNPAQAYQDDKGERRGGAGAPGTGGRGNPRQRKDFNNSGGTTGNNIANNSTNRKPFTGVPSAGAAPGNIPDARNTKRRGRQPRKQSDPSNKPSSPTQVPTQFQLGTAHFPPLGPPSTNSQNKSNKGTFPKDYAKFSRENLIGIVTSLDITKQKRPSLPDSLPSTVVLKEPQTELAISAKPQSKSSSVEEGNAEFHEDAPLETPNPDASSVVANNAHDAAPATTTNHVAPAASADGVAPIGANSKTAPHPPGKEKKRRGSQKETSKGKKDTKQPSPKAARAPGQTWAQVARPTARAGAASPPVVAPTSTTTPTPTPPTNSN